MTGHPRCEKCNGRGGIFHHGRYYRCDCTRVTSAVRDIIRKANEQPGRPYRSPFSEGK